MVILAVATALILVLAWARVRVGLRETDSGPSGSQVVSLLDHLRPPTSADISRKRKTQANLPPTGKRRCKGPVASDLKLHPTSVLENSARSLLRSRMVASFANPAGKMLALSAASSLNMSSQQSTKQRKISKERSQREAHCRHVGAAQ